MRIAACTLAAVAAVTVATPITDPTRAYNFEDLRNAVLDAQGQPVSGSYGKCTDFYVDRTCPGRTLVAGSAPGQDRIGYFGNVAEGSVVTISYLTAGGLEVHHERLLPGDLTEWTRHATELRTFMSPGETLRIRVAATNGEVTTQPTAVEYAVMLAL